MPIPYSTMPREEQEAWLNALDLSMAIIEFPPDGFILHANRNYLDISGYEEDQLLRSTIGFSAPRMKPLRKNTLISA